MEITVQENLETAWERTSAIRILRSPFGIPPADRIQQAWICRDNDKHEWRDVEIEYEPYSKEIPLR